MICYPKAVDFQHSTFVGTWNDSPIPIYDVPSMHALNQLVGYIKLINSGRGTVLYRGQCKLYNTVSPSILHDISKTAGDDKRLFETIEAIMKDDKLLNFFGFRDIEIQGWTQYEKLIVEAALQHYGASTYCVDFVDNHWTALWFGLYKWCKTLNKYVLRDDVETSEDNKFIQFDKTYHKKEYPSEPKLEHVALSDEKIREISKHAEAGKISFGELVKRNKERMYKRVYETWEKEYQDVQRFNENFEKMEKAGHLYLFLYVAETNVPCIHGLYLGEQTYTIDLRRALPSTFLRPCSQHGWIVKGRDKKFDFDSNIACVLRVSVGLAKEMLGNGQLLSQDNFFPNEKIDQGYRVLLARQIDSRLKGKFKKIIGANMIADFG